jgi:hypothetical protein
MPRWIISYDFALRYRALGRPYSGGDHALHTTGRYDFGRAAFCLILWEASMHDYAWEREITRETDPITDRRNCKVSIARRADHHSASQIGNRGTWLVERAREESLASYKPRIELLVPCCLVPHMCIHKNSHALSTYCSMLDDFKGNTLTSWLRNKNVMLFLLDQAS